MGTGGWIALALCILLSAAIAWWLHHRSKYEPPNEPLASRAPIPEVSLLKFRLAFAHLTNDPDQRVESELRKSLTAIDPAFGVIVSPIDTVFGANPSPGDLAQVRALLAKRNERAIIGGNVRDSRGNTVVQLTIYSPDEPLSGVEQPPYFKLPELPVLDAADVLTLAVAMESTAVIRQGLCNDQRRRLSPMIRKAELLADGAARDPTANRDSRARRNFVVGMALEELGYEWTAQKANVPGGRKYVRTTQKANAFYLAALSDWAVQNDTADAAMTILSIGSGLSRGTHDPRELDLALKCLRQAQQMFAVVGDLADEAAAADASSLVLEKLADLGGGVRALEEARSEASRALALIQRDSAPRQWASLQNHLGIALKRMGRDTSNQALTKQAVEAFSAAAYSRDSDPYNWAANQADLGGALIDFSSFQQSDASLRQAAAAYRESLKVFGVCYPAQSANANAGLGQALSNLGMRTNRAEYLEQAIGPYDKALSYRSRFGDVSDQVAALEDMAENLAVLADLKNSVSQLRDAVGLQRRALRILPRARDPQRWALIEGRMGHTLRSLAEFDSSDRELQQAIAADHDALKLITKESNPSQWKELERELAIAYLVMAQREKGSVAIGDANAALTECQKALDATSPDSDPRGWALLQTTIGEAYVLWGEQETATTHLQKGADALSNALRFLTPASDASGWVEAQEELGTALYDIGVRERGTAHLEQAAAELRKLLIVVSAEKDTQKWKEVKQNLDTTLAELKRRGANG